MIARVTGRLESLDGPHALIEAAPGIVLAAGVPAYVRARLEPLVGTTVILYTRFDLEGQAQGASLTPRLVGFTEPADRDFLDVFTSVKGLGVRKALRALAVPPAEIAAAIARRDTKALIKLPEIGKRLAETIVAELHGKVDRWLLAGSEVEALDASALNGPRPAPADALADPLADEALAALIALGQTAAEAERTLARARAALGDRAAEASTADLIAAAFGRTA